MIDALKNRFHRLVVIQTKAQAVDYRNYRRAEGDLVLPIGPEAMYEAEINGWEFCNLVDIWTEDQYNLEKEVSQEKLNALIEELNSYSRRRNSNIGLEIGNYYAFQLWVIINQISFNNFIVRSITENLTPTKVLCYTKANVQAFMELRPDPDCIFAQVLSSSRLYKDGKCEIVKIKELRKISTLREKTLSSLPVPVRAFLQKFRNRNALKNNNSATHNLLVIGEGYDWLKLNQYPAFNEIFHLHLPPDVKCTGKVTPTQELMEIINKSIQREDLSSYDISGLAAALETDLISFAEKAYDIRAMMNKYDAAVTAVLSFPRDNFLAHMAALAGLPVFVWQHGEKGQIGFDPLAIYTELFYATDYFAYAPVVVEQYKHMIGKFRLSNVIAVGSIEKRIEWQGGNTIVYATGKWFKTTIFLDPDTRLYKAHRSILGYLDGVGSSYEVVFKANNTPGLNDVPYQLNNVKVEFDRPFTELLKTAKVIILDTPATTLVEACSTRVPIFVLGGRCKYTDDFLAVIKRRVVWSETLEDLLGRLTVFLETDIYEADVDDQTFLQQYGASNRIAEVAESVRGCLLDRINYFNNKKEC